MKNTIFYNSMRVGKNGKLFTMYKFRTLKETKEMFAQKDSYTRFGRFLRKTKIDELPQLWNVLKGDMRIFGYRAEEERTYNALPEAVKSLLAREKPGIIDLASLAFYDEESVLQSLKDKDKVYWEVIRPLKFTLQMFYMENRSLMLNIAILYIYLKKFLWSIMRK